MTHVTRSKFGVVSLISLGISTKALYVHEGSPSEIRNPLHPLRSVSRIMLSREDWDESFSEVKAANLQVGPALS